MPLKYTCNHIQLMKSDVDLVFDIHDHFQSRYRKLLATDKTNHNLPIIYLSKKSSNILVLEFKVDDNSSVGFAIR